MDTPIEENTLGENEVTTPQRRKDSPEFHGTGGELFGIWIVNILLTMVTFGIYSAWAKVRFRKYMMVMTSFRDERFDYHAKPWPILKGRIVVLILFSMISIGGKISPAISFFFIAAFILALPLLILKSFQFNAHNTSYRNVRFRFSIDFKTAIFDLIKGLIPLIILICAIGVTTFLAGGDKESPLQIVAGVLTLITFFYYLFAAGPIFMNWLYSNLYNNLYYGNVKVSLDSSVKKIFKLIMWPYIKVIMVFFVLLGALAVILAVVAKELIFIPIVLIYPGALLLSVYFPYLIQKFVWNEVKTSAGDSTNTLKFGSYLGLNVINFILMGFTLGLYFPWAKVAMTNLLYSNRILDLESLDGVIQSQTDGTNAIAEEVSEAFDIDFEIGL